MTNWEKSLAFVLSAEGGYSNHPHDRGGRTNLGITVGTLGRARAAGLVDVADVKDLTRADAEKIYRSLYWQASKADCMPYPLCLLHFDAAVNHGVGSAGRLLQRTMNLLCNANLAVDGAVGKLTLAAVDGALKSLSVETLCEKYLDERQAFYDRIVARDPTQKDFCRGWGNRLGRLRKAVREK